MSLMDVDMRVVAKRFFFYFLYSDSFEVFIEIKAHAVLYKAHCFMVTHFLITFSRKAP